MEPMDLMSDWIRPDGKRRSPLPSLVLCCLSQAACFHRRNRWRSSPSLPWPIRTVSLALNMCLLPPGTSAAIWSRLRITGQMMSNRETRRAGRPTTGPGRAGHAMFARGRCQRPPPSLVGATPTPAGSFWRGHGCRSGGARAGLDGDERNAHGDKVTQQQRAPALGRGRG